MSDIEKVLGYLKSPHIYHKSHAIYAQSTVVTKVIKLSYKGHVRFTNIGPMWY